MNITPALGTEIAGYFQTRYAEGVLKVICERICAATGLTPNQIFIHSTHTHTGPVVNLDGINGMQVSGIDKSKQELTRQYGQMLCNKFADAAVMALNDLQPAKMGYAVGNAPNIAFVRRFRMRDGKVRTNPGVGNPDILHPIGDVDERVNVLRFDREGGDTIVIANMGCHSDVVGGSLISGDWPTLFRHRLEKTLDNVKGIFFNGAQGGVNHVNVNAKGGDFNDMFNDFDDVARGYGHARHMANVALAGVPGEPFNGIGIGLKKAEGWDLVLPCCLTNGSEGYFPMQDAYDEGGYEARSSPFKAGTAEIIIKEGMALLDSLR